VPSLIIQHKILGRGRRCDSRCHEAKGTRCTCICKGIFHGVPYFAGRASMTYTLALQIRNNYPGTHVRIPHMQMSLFG